MATNRLHTCPKQCGPVLASEQLQIQGSTQTSSGCRSALLLPTCKAVRQAFMREKGSTKVHWQQKTLGAPSRHSLSTGQDAAMGFRPCRAFASQSGALCPRHPDCMC